MDANTTVQPHYYARHYFGRPAWTFAHANDCPPFVLPGWALGGLTAGGRAILAEYVSADPRRGNTGKVHGPVSPAELREMRGWLADCEWADLDVDSIAELTDAVVLRGVARHYEGGLAEFRRNVEGCV